MVLNKLNDVSDHYQNLDRILPQAHTLFWPISKALGKNISKAEKDKRLIVSTDAKCDKYEREKNKNKMQLLPGSLDVI